VGIRARKKGAGLTRLLSPLFQRELAERLYFLWPVRRLETAPQRMEEHPSLKLVKWLPGIGGPIGKVHRNFEIRWVVWGGVGRLAGIEMRGRRQITFLAKIGGTFRGSISTRSLRGSIRGKDPKMAR